MDDVVGVLRQINQAWLKGAPDAIGDFVADDVVMAIPGFSGRIRGREAFVAGFRQFCESARIDAHKETAYDVDVVGKTAVATCTFDLTYEREGSRYRSTGRDFWIFEERAGRWLAVWRTMFDLTEEPIE